MEKLLEKGQILDLIYLRKFGVGFAHDDVEGAVYKINQDYSVVRFFESSSTNGLGGKQLKTNEDEDCLFVLSSQNSITVFSNPHEEKVKILTKLENLKGTVVTDYHPVKSDKVITVSDNGYLCVYRFAKNFQTMLFQLRLPIFFGQEQVVALSVCPKSRYIIVSSSYISQSNASKLFLLTIDQAYELNLKYQRDFTFEDEFNQPNTLYSHMSFCEYYKNCPLFVGFQLGNKKKLTAFLVHSDRLSEIHNIQNFHDSYSFVNHFYEGTLYSLDLEGTLFMLPMLKST